MWTGNPITIYGGGKQTRDFTHVDDIIRANVLAVTQDSAIGKAVNVATGVASSVNDIVDLVEAAMEKSNYPRTYTATMPEESFRNYADLTNAKTLLGYQPQVTIKDGIREYVEWWKSINS
jgi:UDP-glucose 4-epimerase